MSPCSVIFICNTGLHVIRTWLIRMWKIIWANFLAPFFPVNTTLFFLSIELSFFENLLATLSSSKSKLGLNHIFDGNSLILTLLTVFAVFPWKCGHIRNTLDTYRSFKIRLAIWSKKHLGFFNSNKPTSTVAARIVEALVWMYSWSLVYSPWESLHGHCSLPSLLHSLVTSCVWLISFAVSSDKNSKLSVSWKATTPFVFCVADTGVVGGLMPFAVLREWGDAKVLLILQGFCEFHRYMFNVVYTTSGWMIVLVTCERFIVVWYPLKVGCAENQIEIWFFFSSRQKLTLFVFDLFFQS